MTRIRVRHPLRVTVLALVLLVTAPWVAEAVLVAPHAVFINHRTRTGQVFLVNNGDGAEEITIDLVYGYPDTDSAGNVFVRLIEQPAPDAPSAASWIRAFPRRLRLEPGQRQVVRLLAGPPEGLADGEYWSRLIVTAQGAAAPIATGDSAIQAGVTLVTRTIISVTYRKGAVQTGIAVNEARFTADRDTLVAWLGLAREGNAAYLGQAAITLTDANQREAARWELPMAVYHAVNRRLAFAVDTLPPGTYTARLLLTTNRDDLDDELPAPPVERSAAVEVR